MPELLGSTALHDGSAEVIARQEGNGVFDT